MNTLNTPVARQYQGVHIRDAQYGTEYHANLMNLLDAIFSIYPREVEKPKTLKNQIETY